MSVTTLFRRCRRLALLGAAAIALSSCVGMEGDGRHLQPLPAALVSQMSAKGMSQADPILVRLYKKESELEIWKRDRSGRYALLKTYPMCRWSGQLGPKKREGDRQAPEGFYTVTPELMNPRSQFYLSFNLGYPNALEQAQGYTGSALMVHGACTSAGCYAMTDEGVAEIYALAREAFAGGQRSFQVQAFPFRMTPENLARHRANPHIAFWRNLKEGSDHFEATRQPPRVATCGGRYVFNPAGDASALVPGAPCPAYQTDPEVEPLVAARNARDETRLAELADSLPATSYALMDGGMHRSFRKLLRDLGPERMQTMVAGKVAISQPQAALADPYGGDDEPEQAAATGSISSR
ncbi:murein L,D-transpeptidase family protein [Bosea sp. CS1GBMeth4]|uniref:L,D-transpeptidase family protein n=1 Tax=Bosea sp. CS1GBMeth4 TaxID=1892849 RepID=UPI00164691D0|nr:murein L,D-transpeptidase family protein [Bosea sp. CS1GBMeth4]